MTSQSRLVAAVDAFLRANGDAPEAAKAVIEAATNPLKYIERSRAARDLEALVRDVLGGKRTDADVLNDIAFAELSIDEPDPPPAPDCPPPGDEPVPSITERLEAVALTTEQLKAMPAPPYVVDEVLVQGSLAVLYAPPGAYKTFIALDLGLAVASGSWWHGRAVEPGPVVYVAAEGAGRLGLRVDAWQEHHRIYNFANPVHWLPLAVNLHDPSWASELAAYCAERAAVLVVIDTLARCTVGVDENSAKDMGEVIAQVDAVKRASGACVLLVHHAGKDVSAGARGSSALRAAVDTELEAVAADRAVTLRVRKQKDGAEPAPIPLRVHEVAESCVLVDPSVYRPEDGAELTAGALATLAALRTIQIPGGITATIWAESSPCERRTFYDHRRRLLDAGAVCNIGTPKAPRYVTSDYSEAS